MLVDQVVQFTDVDVIGVEAAESPDGTARVVLVLRGQSIPGGGETLTRVQCPFNPDFAERIGKVMVEEGARLKGAGVIIAQPGDVEPTAAAAERMTGVSTTG